MTIGNTASPDGLPGEGDDVRADVEVVFARGTAEPEGLGREGQAFVDSLKADVKGKSVSVYAVNYPASYDFIQATAGASDASAHVQATEQQIRRSLLRFL